MAWYEDMSRFEVIDNNEESLTKYSKKGFGQEVIQITQKDIEQLTSGKALAIHDGEYTNIVVLKIPKEGE